MGYCATYQKPLVTNISDTKVILWNIVQHIKNHSREFAKVGMSKRHQIDIERTSALVRGQIDVPYEFVQAFVRFLYAIAQTLKRSYNLLRTHKNSYDFLVKDL